MLLCAACYKKTKDKDKSADRICITVVTVVTIVTVVTVVTVATVVTVVTAVTV